MKKPHQVVALALFSGAAAASSSTACSSSPGSATATGSGSGASSSSGSGSGGGSNRGSTSGSSGASSSASTSSSSSTSGSGGATGLHVSGGHIVDGSGNVVQLHGADETGSQTNCTYQSGGSASAGFPGFFDMPNTQAGVSQMLAWKINAVRVPLNEDCWLGINGLPFGGSTSENYQSAIQQFVTLLTGNGLSVILDLHWAGPGTDASNPSLGQIPMADADHAVDFWTSVASAFKGNGSVIYDLYNEPGITDWSCWISGAPASANCAQANGAAYAVAGMATMLQAVRNAGAPNVVILGGLSLSQDFSKWVTSVNSIPTLPAPLDGISIDNVAASWHAYSFNSVYTQCPSQFNTNATTCGSAQQFAASSDITDVMSAGFPVVIGEMGISAYSAATAASYSAVQLTALETWLTAVMAYMEGQGQGYLAWSWDLDQNPVLITDFTTGAPTPYFGVTYQKHLQSTF